MSPAPPLPVCDGMTCFSGTFALLGLKLLFGNKPVTIGSVILLGAVSAAVASAWVGGTGAWVEVGVMNFVNKTLAEGLWLGREHEDSLLRRFARGLRPDLFGNSDTSPEHTQDEL